MVFLKKKKPTCNFPLPFLHLIPKRPRLEEEHPYLMSIILPFFSKEERLVRGLQKQDPKAQREVYESYAGRMMGVCRRYIQDPMAAEDVLVEGFMKVFDRVGQFKQEGSFEGWIRRIMVNEALGYLRQQKRMLDDLPLEAAYQVADWDTAHEQLEAKELVALLEKLPNGYRTVFNLYAIEGYSHAEIATLLSITESTSKSQLHRARALLQQLLENRDPNLKKKRTYEEVAY